MARFERDALLCTPGPIIEMFSEGLKLPFGGSVLAPSHTRPVARNLCRMLAATASPPALHLAFSAECNPVRLSWSLPTATHTRLLGGRQVIADLSAVEDCSFHRAVHTDSCHLIHSCHLIQTLAITHSYSIGTPSGSSTRLSMPDSTATSLVCWRAPRSSRRSTQRQRWQSGPPLCTGARPWERLIGPGLDGGGGRWREGRGGLERSHAADVKASECLADVSPPRLASNMRDDPLVDEEGYPSYNKPYSLMAWLEAEDIAEDYIMMLDGDMLLREPIDPVALGAARGRVVSAEYTYLVGTEPGRGFAERFIATKLVRRLAQVRGRPSRSPQPCPSGPPSTSRWAASTS